MVFKWTPDCAQAFRTLQEHLSSFPILKYPDFSQPFEVEIDTSDVDLGTIQSQGGQVVEYAS